MKNVQEMGNVNNRVPWKAQNFMYNDKNYIIEEFKGPNFMKRQEL